MTLNPEDVIKILLAVAAGGLIGIEREYRDKAAGFRTLIFICAGACLFTILSARLAPSPAWAFWARARSSPRARRSRG